jgi:hypothetical protein
MAQMNRLPVSRMETFLYPPSLARELWLRAYAPLNHRYDKLGNPLPMELHGCGCGLCARQKRDRLPPGSPRSGRGRGR